MSMSLGGLDEAKLAPIPREFLAGLLALLDELRPGLLDPGMTKATPRDDGVEVVLAHARDARVSLWAQAAADGVVVGCAALHSEHRDAADALAVVRALLCGEHEVCGYDGAPLRPRFI